MAQRYTPDGDQALDALAQRYGLTRGAVESLLVAVNLGGGTMAQFSVPELGGSGQWMRGGMTMVGNMFDHGLKSRVDSLCNELSALLASTTQVFDPVSNVAEGFGQNWWPSELGVPSSSGGQNDARYAYFPRVRRLAVQSGGRVTLYDTLDHSIGGVSQQQGSGPKSLQFSSQFGTFGVTSLPQISTDSDGHAEQAAQVKPEIPAGQQSPSQQQSQNDRSEQAPNDKFRPSRQQPAHVESSAVSTESIIASIEALAGLHARGILSDEEYSAKKAELLSRL